MNLSRKVVLIGLTAGFIALTSCKDEKAEAAEKAKVEEQAAIEKAAVAAEAAKIEAEKITAEMRATSIAAVASKNQNLSTLVSALKAADLVEMMTAEGSYTVFAPNNNAFQKLPSKLGIAELAKPENKELLTSVLQYHVVAGNITSEKLVKAIEGAGGKYVFKTVNGKELEASMKKDQIIIKDEKNNKVTVLQGNFKASNGVVHVVSGVLLSK